MHCERCQQEAAKVFLTHMVGGKVQKVDLCEKCARELGVTSNEPYTLSDLLLKSTNLEQPDLPGAPGQDSCPQCGCTLADVKKSGRFGCASCYEVFLEFIEEAVQTMQKGPCHRGKCPVVSRKAFNPVRRREIEQALALAIKSENYEHAAQLRDQLREFEAAV